VRREAAADGLYTFVNREVDLHGTGIRSRLLVFRKTPPHGVPMTQTSDEIRIYDETGHKLSKRFKFRPEPSSISHYGYRFRLNSVKAFDSSDREEVLGSYSTVYMNAEVVRPIIIVWNEGAGQYQAHALLTAPIHLTGDAPSGYGGAAQYAGETLRDTSAGIVLRRAQGTEGFTIIRRGEYPLLLATFVAGADCHACPPTIQLKGWQLDF
jgi:hypothetical protein